MSELVGKQLRDFFGEFLEYFHKNNTGIWRESTRIKIKLGIRKPLKRKKKITRKNVAEVIVNCNYERLGDFCFSCRLVSHTERFCEKFLDREGEVINKEWRAWLRPTPRRMGVTVKSKWCRRMAIPNGRKE